MTAPCPGCHGSGIEPSGVTYAGISEYVGCHECSPDCPRDCGCWVGAGPEGADSGAGDGLGVALCSPVSPSAAEPLRGAQRGAEHVSDAEAAEWGRLLRHRQPTCGAAMEGR